MIRILAVCAAALALVASTSAGTAVRYDYWHYTLVGVQVMHWKATAHFDRIDGNGVCVITHQGDQTFRFGTGGPIRVRLHGGASVPVEARSRGKWRELVPIVGTEKRVHTVVSAPPDVSNCDQRALAEADATPCSVTKPLSPGAVEKTGVLKKPPQVTMYDPLAYAFQRKFPTCHAQGFDLKQSFFSVLFTRGALVKLRGGTFYSRHAKLRGGFKTGLICIRDFPDAPGFVRCSTPHNATVETSWRMTFSR